MTHLSNWIEIPATDLKRARTFYERVLQMEMAPLDLGPVQYAMFPSADRLNAGALVQGEGYTPSATGISFYLDGTDDFEGKLKRVAAHGGTVLLPRTYVGPEAGYIALFLDSEGNKVGLQSMS